MQSGRIKIQKSWLSSCKIFENLSLVALSKSRLYTIENKSQENKDLKLVFTSTKSENKHGHLLCHNSLPYWDQSKN